MTSPFCWLLVLNLYKEDNLQICKSVSFWLHSFYGWREGLDPVNGFNHTSWVAIVTPNDRPKSVRNRCVIENFGGVLVLPRCFLIFSVIVGLLSLDWVRSRPFFLQFFQYGMPFARSINRSTESKSGNKTSPVPFGTFVCSNVETILSWTCHVYGPYEFRTSLGTSILLWKDCSQHLNMQVPNNTGPGFRRWVG